jgi:hypothetical protein
MTDCPAAIGLGMLCLLGMVIALMIGEQRIAKLRAENDGLRARLNMTGKTE